MADAVMNLLVESLCELITEKVRLIKGAKEELDNLLQEITILKAFLEDNAQQDSNSNLWKNFVKNIRIQAHKADDVIDKFLLEAKLHQEKNIWKKTFGLCGHTRRVSNLAQVIKIIRRKVKEIQQNNSEALVAKPMLNLGPKTLARDPQDTFLEVKNIVGFIKEANEVIERLVEGTEEIECIPIVGMTGLGKTTLARKVWSDSQIIAEFSNNIWVSVGQSNELKNIFLVIIKSSTGPNQEIRCNGENELAKVIASFVTEQHRCLIVLDDVWASELVDFFKNVLPENKKGHRILMTTRHRDVASCASKKPYHLKFLNQEDSFRLLEKRVVDNGSCLNDQLVELGKSTASKCGGLPLALLVIAKALKGNQTVYFWKRIENNFWQYVMKENDTTSCWKIVEASYVSLSSEMKACFLYCLAFPKGYDIPFQMLIRLWMAEGLIESSPINFSSSEDKAENYLMEFENLDLVIVSREITGSIKRVKCNEIFYEFYKMEVTKECVFQELCKPDFPSINDPDTSRRLHIVSCDLSAFISRIPSAEHVRSFLCFPSKDVDQQTKSSSIVHDIQPILKAFPLLRVLKIESINIPSLKNLNQLFHLRYISISGNFKELPAFFSKFWSLQSIIINTSQPTLNIKANIWNMSKLTHLKINKPSKLPLPSTQKGKGSSSIQTLSKIAPETCNKDVLGEASNSLKKLSIQGKIEDSLKTNSDRFSTFEGFQTFAKFECLENLKLISDVPCHSNAFQFPKALFRFLLKLKKLTLSKTMFDWKEATKLGQLECLEVLKLKTDAFTGKSWNPEKGDFRKLQVLLIHSNDLHTWEASGSHFPKLRVLVLECPKLESVPAELSQFQQ
ncbi:disease resistance protein RPP13-like [Solanum stenotomum]|uniref:disease resistance protein RPP13-like n=1 Tax=Solanum stenotomum TaxID=172797 RepID=UPI0020D160D9|nr:disease resistance protein RPP13-like [Solanum stenotomum]